MNFKLTSLSILIVAIAITGCMKSTPTTDTGGAKVDPITGNFVGELTLVHLNPRTSKGDTAYANVNILLNPDLTYSVSGDTTTIQYPSHGTFLVDYGNSLINFTDQTVTKTTNLNTKKKHLTGTFIYSYSSPNLHVYGASDTLFYNYVLVKQ